MKLILFILILLLLAVNSSAEDHLAHNKADLFSPKMGATVHKPEQRDDGLRVAALSAVTCDREALSKLVVQLKNEEFGKVCSLLIAKEIPCFLSSILERLT